MVLALTPLAVYPAPEALTLEMVTLEFPLLVKVTFSELLLPVFTLPKLRVVGLAARRCVAVTPVPLRLIPGGELGALLTKEMEPL